MTNDGSVITLAGEAEDERNDSKNTENMDDALDVELILVDPTKNPFLTEVSAPLPLL